MYFIASGAVEIAVGEQRLRLGRGDFFGEMALLDQTRRSAAVRSISYSHLLFLPRAAFEEIGQFLPQWRRSEEHTSELQSLLRISYAVFCLKKKNKTQIKQQTYKYTTYKTHMKK